MRYFFICQVDKSGKGKAFPNKSGKLGGGIECWASILTPTFRSTRTAELSALRAGLREFLKGRVRLSGRQGYWMRTEGISKDPTGNRTRHLPSCGVVPQPTAPPLADKAGTGWKGTSDCDLSSVHCVRDVSWSWLRLTCQIINVTCCVKKAFHLEFGRHQVVTKTGDRQACSIITYLLHGSESFLRS
jgi:hypothetical protein